MKTTASNDGLNSIWENESQDYLRVLNQEKLILKVTEEVWCLLEKLGLSKADLAERLGVSRAHVTQLLNGNRNMTLRSLADIGFFLDRPVNIEFGDHGTGTSSDDAIASHVFSSAGTSSVQMCLVLTNKNSGVFYGAETVSSSA